MLRTTVHSGLPPSRNRNKIELDFSIWIRLELPGPLGGLAVRIEFKCFVSAPFRKSSNGRKIARMARNLTIFGPNRSRRRELNFEKNSNERANEQTNDLYNFFSKMFRNFRRDPRSLDLNYRFGLFFPFSVNMLILMNQWKLVLWSVHGAVDGIRCIFHEEQ